MGNAKKYNLIDLSAKRIIEDVTCADIKSITGMHSINPAAYALLHHKINGRWIVQDIGYAEEKEMKETDLFSKKTYQEWIDICELFHSRVIWSKTQGKLLRG